MYAIRSYYVRRRWLLREGAWVTGRVVGVKGTNTRVNNRTVLEVSYLFESPAGERRGKTRVMDAPAMDAEVLVLYDPDAPARNLIVITSYSIHYTKLYDMQF